jgi:predicted deacylase
MSEDFNFTNKTVEKGESKHTYINISETYLGDNVKMPVSIINSEKEGPTVFLSAAIHGDELNGIEVVRTVAREWDHKDIKGTLICVPVMNVLGFLTQKRNFPILNRDLNRSFPGKSKGKSSSRVADIIWNNFILKSDICIDFHTSTRGRSNMLHVRGDLEKEGVEKLAKSFYTNIIMNTDGPDGSLRKEATEEGIPTITVEIGQAHRFERQKIDKALQGVKNVLCKYNVKESQGNKNKTKWTETIEGWDEKTWIRANSGGIVEINHQTGDLIKEGEIICKISNPFKTEVTEIKAPFTGIIVGLLKNPVVYPGNPICHFIDLDEETVEKIENN